MIRKIFALIKTDFMIQFAYPISWVFFLGLPVLFTIVIGVALGGTQTTQASASTEDTRPAVLVIDLDQTASSMRLLGAIADQKTIQSTTVNTFEAARLEQEQNTHTAILTIPAGFETALKNNQTITLSLTLGEKDYTAIAIENALRSASQHSMAIWKAARGSLLIVEEIIELNEEAYQSQLMKSLEQAEQVLADPFFTTTRHEDFNQAPSTTIMNGFNQSSAGQLVTWTLITLLGGSVIFAMERENGTLQRLTTTPTSRFTYFSGKLLSRLLMSMIQMVILVLFGSYVLQVDWGNAPLTLLAFLVCFGFAGTAFGLMLGSLTNTSKQADALTTLFSMLLASLGGAWWPLEITPPLYQSVVRILPTTWAMLGFNDIIIKQQGLSGVLPEMAVLLGFGVAFSVVGILKLGIKVK